MISSDAGVAGTGAAGEAGMSGGAYAGTGYGGAYAGMGYGGAYAGTGYGGVGGYPAGGYGGAGGCGFDPNCGCCPDTHCGTGGSGEPFCVPAPGVYAPCADCARLGESWVDVWVDSNGWIECTILQGQVGCFEHCVQRCDPWFGCVGMGGAGGVGGGPAGMGGVGGGPAGMGGVGGGPADDPARPDGGSADEPAWPDASTPE